MNMNMIVCDRSSYSCQLCSPYVVDYTSTIWFTQVRVARAGVEDLCPNNCFAILDMAATIRVGPGCLVSNCKCEFRFGMMGKGKLEHITSDFCVLTVRDFFRACVGHWT